MPVGEPDLRAELAALRDILLERPLVAPAAEEARLLEVKRTVNIPSPVVFLVILLLPVMLLVAPFSETAATVLFTGLFISLMALYVARAGEYWLTGERLVWKPMVGEPVAVSLRSIRWEAFS